MTHQEGWQVLGQHRTLVCVWVRRFRIGNLRHLALLGVLSLLLCGCGEGKTYGSDDVDPDALFPSYQVGFDQDAAEVFLSAAFTLGESTGSRVSLEAPAQVAVNGVTLGPGAPSGSALLLLAPTDYALNVSRSLPPSAYTFVLTRPDRRLIESQVPVVAPVQVDLDSVPQQASRRRQLRVALVVDETEKGDLTSAQVSCLLQILGESSKDTDSSGSLVPSDSSGIGARQPNAGRLGPDEAVPAGSSSAQGAVPEPARLNLLEEPAQGGVCIFKADRLALLPTGPARLATRAEMKAEQLSGFPKGGQWRSVTLGSGTFFEIVP